MCGAMHQCAACYEDLVLLFNEEDYDSAAEQNGTEPEETDKNKKTVPDDVELPCGCHFHWYVSYLRYSL